MWARADDASSAGGNAFSGATSNVNGGYVVNDADDGPLKNGDYSE